MSARSRWVPLSPARRLVGDICRISQAVPLVTAERTMNLAPLVEARRACPARPAWSVILAKAYALVARDLRELRRSYIAFPWPHLYEHPESVGTITVEREHNGENVVLFAQMRRPEQRSLLEMDSDLRRHQDAPVQSLGAFKRALWLAAFPRPLRSLCWWLSLHASGKWREKYYGNFALSSPAAHGAGMARLLVMLTAGLHYTLFDADDRLTVYLTFDHRVYDGATAARALRAMEDVLTGELVQELTGAASRAA